MNNLTPDEKKAILHWSSPSSNRLYRKIKNASHNKYLKTLYEVDEDSQKNFEVIEKMFDKYEDNTHDINIIYRTDIIDNEYNIEMTEKELFDKFCSKFEINKIFILKEILCSFSASKKVSEDTAKSNIQKYSFEKNTPIVTYTIKKRLSKYLYIASYTNSPHEEEVLYFGLKKFKVLDLKNYDVNHIEIIIEEVD